MKQAMTMAVLAACTNMVDAHISPRKLALFEKRGVDIDLLYRKNEIWQSRSALSMHKSAMKSKRLQTVHRYNRLKQQGTDLDNAFEEEEQRVIELACANIPEGEECTQEEIDYVDYVFQALKGVVVGVSSVYSDDCRAGLVGIVDSCLNIYNHIEVYLPENINKFAMAFNDLTEAGNSVFANCDLTHFYNELTKLGDYQNWEQYVEIAARAGGVCIDDMWTHIDIIDAAVAANDGYALGQSVGELVSLFLDTIL